MSLDEIVLIHLLLTHADKHPSLPSYHQLVSTVIYTGRTYALLRCANVSHSGEAHKLHTNRDRQPATTKRCHCLVAMLNSLSLGTVSSPVKAQLDPVLQAQLFCTDVSCRYAA